MARTVLAICLTLVGCSSETSLLVVVDGDIRPGADVDRLTLRAVHDRLQLWVWEESLDEGTPFPRRVEMRRTARGEPSLSLDLTGSRAGERVVWATRPVELRSGETAVAQLCLMARCVGSIDPSCERGPCAPDEDGADSGVGGDADSGQDGGTGADGGPTTDAEGVGTVDSCVPDCRGRECGPDGCGGRCGPDCAHGECHEATGLCRCEPSCGGASCGPDGCGGTCPPGCGEGDYCRPGEGRCAPAPSWTEVHPLESPPPRSGHAMTFDPSRGVVVLFGGLGEVGDGAEGALDDTWEYDGSTWTEVHAGAGPPARSGAAMVYDAARGASVLFGGEDPAADVDLSGTWSLDGDGWTEEPLSTAPAPRAGHGMAHDGALTVTVVYGGWPAVGGARLQDTWVLDGGDWRSRALEERPPPMSYLSFDYSPASSCAFAFGGELDDGGLSGETWTYCDGVWGRALPRASPAPRARHCAAHDPRRDATVVFGGWSGSRRLDDTWELSGGEWAPVPTGAAPGPRSSAAIAYDADREVMVLFGGNDDAPGRLADTWEYGP